MIFSRNRARSDQRAGSEQTGPARDGDTSLLPPDGSPVDSAGGSPAASANVPTAATADSSPVAWATVADAGGAAAALTQRGPYDVREAPADVQRLDLGSLQIPAVDGVEVRLQANPDGGVEQVVLVHGDSALQLGVFAAPRSEGIWAEVREEIRTAMAADAVPAQEVAGPYGVELLAEVATPDGPADVRFVGIDGPRWMVRALYQGLAATDPGQEGPLGDCLSGLVVARDEEARPVREALPLRLPHEMAEQAQQHQDQLHQDQLHQDQLHQAQVDGGDLASPDAPLRRDMPSVNGGRS